MRAARVRAVLIALTVAACASGATSAPLPAAQQPTWTAPIDSRTTEQWLSESAGVVYGARGGKVVAVDLHTGRTRWTASVAAVGRSVPGSDERERFEEPVDRPVEVHRSKRTVAADRRGIV